MAGQSGSWRPGAPVDWKTESVDCRSLGLDRGARIGRLDRRREKGFQGLAEIGGVGLGRWAGEAELCGVLAGRGRDLLLASVLAREVREVGGRDGVLA
jgi:hypothetical protein